MTQPNNQMIQEAFKLLNDQLNPIHLKKTKANEQSQMPNATIAFIKSCQLVRKRKRKRTKAIVGEGKGINCIESAWKL